MGVDTTSPGVRKQDHKTSNRSPNWAYFSSSPRLTEYRAITYWREALHSASRKWGFMYPSARLKPISPVVSLKDIEPAPCPLVFVSSSRARGAQAGEAAANAALRLRQETVLSFPRVWEVGRCAEPFPHPNSLAPNKCTGSFRNEYILL